MEQSWRRCNELGHILFGGGFGQPFILQQCNKSLADVHMMYADDGAVPPKYIGIPWDQLWLRLREFTIEWNPMATLDRDWKICESCFWSLASKVECWVPVRILISITGSQRSSLRYPFRILFWTVNKFYLDWKHGYMYIVHIL